MRKERLADLPWHTPLLAAALVIGLFNDTLVHPAAAVRALVVMTLVAALAAGSTLLLGERSAKAAAILTLLLVVGWTKHLFRAYGDVARWLTDVQAWIWTLLIVLAVALAARIALRVLPRMWNDPHLTRQMNALAALLLAAVLITTVVGGGAASAIHDLQPTARPASASGDDRDIYVLLLDGYARGDVLEWRFGFDNSPFLDGLNNRGFTVAANSRSPYLSTHVVLPTMLHRKYLEQIPSLNAVYEGEAPVRPTLRRTISDNPVFDQLRERGYVVAATQAGWEDYALRSADEFLDSGQMNEFELKLLYSSFLGDLIAMALPDIGSSQIRGRIVDSLEYLPGLAARRGGGPLFVFAHIPAPHQPTVFGPNGEAVVTRFDSRFFVDTHVEAGMPLAEFQARYVGEVQHLNRLVLDAIDGILAASAEPPVIIVMSDHGSATRVNWLETSPSEASRGDLLERTATLFAALTPGRSNVFPDDIVTVDILGRLSDAYFGTAYGAARPPAGGRQVPPIDASILGVDE